MKICPTCKIEKAISEYWKGQSYCIPCASDAQKNKWFSRTPKKRLEEHLKYKYGVSMETFNKALEEQEGKCAICESELPDLYTYENRRRGYAIDHNHETKEFRAILCLKCNSLLGMAGDSIEVLGKAIQYLERFGSYARKPKSKASKQK